LISTQVAALGARLGADRVVVVLDQNMNYADGDVFGTDVCRALRANAWRGVVLIQSANAEPSDVAAYVAAGADGCIAKGVAETAQHKVLADAYRRRFPGWDAAKKPKVD